MINAVRFTRRLLSTLIAFVPIIALTVSVASVTHVSASAQPVAVGCAGIHAAVYCTEDGGVDIYSVANGVGRFDFHVTPEELDASLNPGSRVLIAQGYNSQGINVQLWRLPNNDLEVVSPLPPDQVTHQVKMFVFIWEGC
jgi:hypothetical protein